MTRVERRARLRAYVRATLFRRERDGEPTPPLYLDPDAAPFDRQQVLAALKWLDPTAHQVVYDVAYRTVPQSARAFRVAEDTLTRMRADALDRLLGILDAANPGTGREHPLSDAAARR